MRSRSSLASVILLLSVGCGGGGGGGGDAPDGGSSTVELRGTVAKGPFIVGSSIEVSILDDALNPTGAVYTTETSNDRGEFSVSFPPAGAVAVKGEGVYYNELRGDISGSAMTLRAFYVPSGMGPQDAYVNIITHLTTGRVKQLVGGGAAFSEAVLQAEGELRAALAITPASFAPSVTGTQMNVAGADNDDNAYLLAVSTVLTQVAVDRGGDIDGKVQEVVNEFAAAFATGALTAPQQAEVGAALAVVLPGKVQADLAAYLAAKGHTGVVPDMNRVLDQDRDDLANAEDNCPLAPNPQQENGDGDARGDACDPCPTTLCADQCLPAGSIAGQASDLCYVACETETAGACEAGSCARVVYGEDGLGNEVALQTCVSGCDPAAPACAAGGSCALVGTSAGLEVWGCLPDVLGGTLGVGSPCGRPEQCEPGLACLHVDAAAGASFCLQPCDPGAPVVCGGEACIAWSAPVGGENLSVCEVPPGQVGQPCAQGTCAPGLACAPLGYGGCDLGPDVPAGMGCCQPAGDQGQPCPDDGEACNGELGCVGAASCAPLGSCCLPAGGPGEPCDGEMCDAGYVCVHGDPACAGVEPCCLEGGGYLERCGTGGAGGGCDAGLQCTPSGPAPCPVGLDMCCAINGTSTFGLPCADGTCAEGLACTTGGCPYPTADCCLPAGTGGPMEPCDSGTCDSGLACVALGAVGGCANGLPECCLAAGGPGQPCLAGTCADDGASCVVTGCAAGLPDCCQMPDCPCGAVPGTECTNSPLCGPLGDCCLPAGGQGEQCYVTDPRCDGDLECLEGRTPTGSYCLDLSAMQCCQAVGGEGERCRLDGSCDGDLACSLASLCVQTGGLGEPCVDRVTCDPGLACSRPYAPDGVCVPAGGLGELCLADGECEMGLSCVMDDVVCDDGGTGVSQPCCLVEGAGRAGEPCDVGVCLAGLDCQVGGCPWATADCCMPVSSGGPGEACDPGPACDGDLECVPGCVNGLPECCQVTGAEGEPCNPGGACDTTDLACVEGTCQPAGGVYEACRADGPSCDGSLTCRAGRCPTGYPTCCLPDACDPAAPGTCTRANGQVCAQIYAMPSLPMDLCGWPGAACCLDAGDVGELCFADAPRCGTDAACAPGDACGGLAECCQLSGGVDEPCNDGGTCDDVFTTRCSTGTGCPGGLTSCCLEAGDANEPCFVGDSCSSTELVCYPSSWACDSLGLSTCCLETGGAGQPCNGDNLCDTTDLMCTSTSGCAFGQCCIPWGGVGEPCGGGLCDDPAISVCDMASMCGGPFGIGCCVATGGLGEPCNEGGTCDDPGATSCITSIDCGGPDGRGCCVATGAFGEPCNPDGTCDTPATDTCAASSLCTTGSPCCLHAGALNQPCYETGLCGGGLSCTDVGCLFGLSTCCK